MRSMPKTLDQLCTICQTSTAADLPLIPYLKHHAGMFMVLEGKIGRKMAREWLIGVAVLELFEINAKPKPFGRT